MGPPLSALRRRGVFGAKIFSGADGVDPDASRDVALDGVFIHAWDDAVAVKTTSRAPFAAGNATFLFDCKNDDIAAGGVEVAGLDVDWGARWAAPGSARAPLGDASRRRPRPADAARVASWKLMLADGAAVELTFASPGDLEASRLALLVGGFTLGAAAGRCGRREALDAENASKAAAGAPPPATSACGNCGKGDAAAFRAPAARTSASRVQRERARGKLVLDLTDDFDL
ncbi:hypothetical protein SO694_00123090 [Aureococcus anophagefferens]|uniref:Uncharacterized protein n=1 Tax=Aureococcus anophagefferens TaxID=44056 RepID=A0ABR1FIX0_AURAN